MPRSSWSPDTPDIRGVAFAGIGVTSHPIHSKENWRGLRFTAQRTGEVDEIALYSGRQTVDTLLPSGVSPGWMGHRAPYLVELYPLVGFGHPSFTTTTYTSTITASANVVDEVTTPPEGNELATPNDNLYLAQVATGFADVTVHMPSASGFALDRQVLSVAVETNLLRQMRVIRVDQNGGNVWQRILAAGLKISGSAWHMGEAYLEAGDTAAWRLWTPTDVRQFASSVGNRRLRVISLSKTQSQIIDTLRLHVDHVPEERVGVGIIETDVVDGWFTIPFHQPGATGTPASIVSGTEYVLVIRTPAGNGDYQVLTRYDLQAVSDTRQGNVFVHFEGLDWDLHQVLPTSGGAIRQLGELVDGLPAIRLLNNGAQTVDSQPYERTVGARVGIGMSAVQNNIDRDSALTEYGQVQFLASNALGPVGDLDITVESIGTFTATHEDYDASPIAGTDELGHEYRQVTIPFGAGTPLGVDPFDLTFTSPASTGQPWLVSTLAASALPGTGNETFEGATSSASGFATDPRDGNIKALSVFGSCDLQAALVSQPAELGDLTIEYLTQPVTGGVCEPCGPEQPLGCTVLGIPYPRVCWGHTTDVEIDEFVHYELQRRDYNGEFATVVVIGTEEALQVTGGPVSGSGVPNCWDDWSVPYESPVQYRVRVRRMDGAQSDWSTPITATVEMAPGADLVITNPAHPEMNVAFPETYTAAQPQREWTILDADQVTFRAMYNRDGYVAFRPTERLGKRFRRQLLVSALCTTMTEPGLDVVKQLENLQASSGPFLVVRDYEQHRWYAAIRFLEVTQVVDAVLGDLWIADVEVTEVSTPVIDPDESAHGGGH